MQNNKQPIDDNNELNISLTAYRALFLLAILMEEPCSAEDIIEQFKNNPITRKSLSKDTVRVTINTLKAAGCVISRPTSKNKYKYFLTYNPFGICMKKNILESLNKIRENIYNIGDWQLVAKLNDFYRTIFNKLNDANAYETVIQNEPFADIHSDILSFFFNTNIEHKEYIIKYESPQNGLEDLKIIADKVFFEEGKLYLWCYLYKYDSYAYLRLDKIKTIVDSGKKESFVEKPLYNAVYKLSGDSMFMFRPNEYEVIMEKTENHLIIEASVLNEFNFMQRILMFGSDFCLISPDNLKAQIKTRMKDLLERYTNE